MTDPTPPASSPRRRSPKRAAVLAAATAEFLAHGFAGTSMDRIAEAARVSKRTVYDHFPSKDVLFQAIADEILERVGRMPKHTYAKDRPMDGQLQAIAQSFADTITDAEFMDLSRVVIARFIETPAMAEKTINAHRRLRRDMVALFKAGKRDGRLSVRNPEMAAAQLCGLIKELAFWPQLTAGQAPLSTRARRAAVTSAVTLFLDHYGAGPEG